MEGDIARPGGPTTGPETATAGPPAHTDSPVLEPSLVDVAVQRRIAPQQQSAEDEVRRLLSVALRLMVEGGSSRPPRVADIVQAAGLSNDAFYRSFRSKDDLVAAVVDEGARRLVSYVRHRMEREADPVAQIRSGIEAVMKQAADPAVAAATRAVFQNASRVGGQGTTDRVQLTWWIAGLFEAPMSVLGAPDPVRDARTATLASLAAMRHFIWAEDVPIAADVDHLVAFVLRAIRADRVSGETKARQMRSPNRS